MNDSEISVLEGEDQMLFATEREGFTAAVIVDGTLDVEHLDVAEAFHEIGRELGHRAYVGSHLLGNRRAREARQEEREETVVPDGGEPIDDPRETLLDISEELEAIEEQLKPLNRDPERVIGSISGEMSMICIDMANALEESGANDYRIDDDQTLTDGGLTLPETCPNCGHERPTLVSSSPLGGPDRDRRLDCCNLEWPPGGRVLTDGGTSLPAGVSPPDETEVASWAADFGLGQSLAFDVDGHTLEAELLGFSDWEEYQGLPVVRPPDELEFDEHIDLFVVREQDLVQDDQGDEDQPRPVPDGGQPEWVPEQRPHVVDALEAADVDDDAGALEIDADELVQELESGDVVTDGGTTDLDAEHVAEGRICVCDGPYGWGERCKTCGGILPEPNLVGVVLILLLAAVPVAFAIGLLFGVFAL